jgi:hypothetical protein
MTGFGDVGKLVGQVYGVKAAVLLPHSKKSYGAR